MLCFCTTKEMALAGDLNALPESPEIAELKKGFPLR